jgi:hypothetical protein
LARTAASSTREVVSPRESVSAREAAPSREAARVTPAGRGEAVAPPKRAARVNGKSNGKANGKSPAGAVAATRDKAEAKVLFEKLMQTAGPRSYAAHVKELPNGNHLLILSEGKRDGETGEIRTSRLLIYGEDFSAFFKLLHETAGFIRANPLSDEIRQKRNKFWAKKNKAEKHQKNEG